MEKSYLKLQLSNLLVSHRSPREATWYNYKIWTYHREMRFIISAALARGDPNQYPRSWNLHSTWNTPASSSSLTLCVKLVFDIEVEFNVWPQQCEHRLNFNREETLSKVIKYFPPRNLERLTFHTTLSDLFVSQSEDRIWQNTISWLAGNMNRHHEEYLY